MSVPFEQLVLGGGGAKGFVMLGALGRLADAGTLVRGSVSVVAGTSIGAVIGLLWICGIDPFDLFTRLVQNEIRLHLGVSLGLETLAKLGTEFGLLDVRKVVGEPVRELVCTALGVARPPTLRELLRKTGKTLRVVVTDLDREEEAVLCPKTAPDMDCVEAVCASSNIPFPAAAASLRRPRTASPGC
jgi:predicted acylesterase/phospholipase RssA